MQVESKLSSGQVRCPVILPFITKQTKVLFNFLIFVFYLAITLKMTGSSETGFDIKVLVEGSYKTSSKLWATIREEFFWNSMKAEYIEIIDVGGILSCKIRLAGHKVALIQVVIDIDANEIEAI
jgi:hypothetical protein